EVDGVRLLDADAVAAAIEVQSSGPDHVLGVPMSFGSGFMSPSPSGPPGSFGHDGAGGSLGLADPGGGWSLGYVMNQMQLGVAGDPRSAALVDAVVASLEKGA
ncbi:MAG: serine hydrolase, partial [Microthrixaceae bacterium]|nr:serine hydrolase [Microthrixaceae bacterium]